jgi:hypothetical protein
MFYESKEGKINGIFMFRESENILKMTPWILFFINLVPQDRKSVGTHGCKTLGSIYLNQQNPLETDPFGITYMQVKSHLRHLLGLQEPSFSSSDGMGGDHPFHSYLSVCA